jgi:hypothetical protein
MDQMTRQFEEVFDSLQEQFYVKSWVSETAKVIFILESPHVQELKYGAPVSGLSGTTMAKHLFGPEYQIPLGRMILKNTEERLGRPSLDAIGLMNICGIPMQRKAYGDSAVMKRYKEFFDILESVRTGNQQDVYRDESWNVLQEVILERFRDRLNGLKGRACTLVPCGRFAQKFFRLAGISDPLWHVIDDVPHPSYNSWDRERYQRQVGTVKESLARAKAELGGVR